MTFVLPVAKPPMSATHATRPQRLLRFAALGLKWNPYRVPTSGEQRELYVPLHDLPGCSALEIARGAARFTQINGESGWGKSTLLGAVRDVQFAEEIKYQDYYLSPEGPFCVKPSAPGVRHLLIDEAQRLSRRGRREIRKWLHIDANRRLIVTTHDNLDGEFGEPETTIELRPIDADRLRQFLVHRVKWAGGDPERFELPLPTADWLIDRCGHNLRFIEMVLYEFFQSAGPSERIVDELGPLHELARKAERVLPAPGRVR